MTRSYKKLLGPVVTVFAVGALFASSAQAAPKLTPANEQYPMTLGGLQQTKEVFTLSGSRTIECETASLSGKIASKAEAETSKITLTPAYLGCTATLLGNVTPATITMNGCDYVFSLTEAASGQAKEEGFQFTGGLEIVCPSGSQMEIHVWSSSAAHTSNSTPLCTWAVVPPKQLSSVDYRLVNGGTEGVLKETIGGLTVDRLSGTLTNCGPLTQTGATYTGTTGFEGFNAGGEMKLMLFDP